MGSEWLWYFSRGAGTVTLVLLCAVLALGILGSARTRLGPGSLTTLTAVHRGVALGACVFLVLHVATALADTYVHVGWLAVAIPFASAYHPLAVGLGTVAADLALAVVCTSVLRHRLPESWWRTVHWLAYGVAVVGLAHAVIMASSDAPLLLGISVVCLLVVATAMVARIAAGLRGQRVADPVAGDKEWR